MLIKWRPRFASGLRLVAAMLGCAAALPMHAADGERGISIYDKYPECMKPDELKPEERKKCVVQDGPPYRPIRSGQSTDRGDAPAPGKDTRGGVENSSGSGPNR